MERRKDSNGRVLKSGECQRKNGSYMYRYTDKRGKRYCLYGSNLSQLRKKEAERQKDIMDEIDSEAAETTVSELIHMYFSLKRGMSQNSIRGYQTVIGNIDKSDFGQLQIGKVKLYHVKKYYVGLHDAGLKRNTISMYHYILRPAFEMAVDNDMIRKNPCKFNLSDFLPNDAQLRTALTPEQQETYLQYVWDTGNYGYYWEILILLETGLRVSELYGLTKADVDMKNRRIHIDHQLCRTAEQPYFIRKPKTNSGTRYIPMSDTAYHAFQQVMENKAYKKTELMIGGYSNFLFIDKSGFPKVAMNLEGFMRTIQKKIDKEWRHTFPHVSPHVLRHTFCTNMQRSGIDIKSLQYLMGHSNVSVTLDVYTHTDYTAVEDAFHKVTKWG